VQRALARCIRIAALVISGLVPADAVAARVTCPEPLPGMASPPVVDIAPGGADTFTLLAGRHLWHFSRSTGQIFRVDRVGGMPSKVLPLNSGNALLLGPAPALHMAETGLRKGLGLPPVNHAARGGDLIALANADAVMGMTPEGQYLGRMTFVIDRVSGSDIVPDPIEHLAVSGDGRHVALASAQGRIQIVDFTGRSVVLDTVLPDFAPLALRFRERALTLDLIGRDGRGLALEAGTGNVTQSLPVLAGGARRAMILPGDQGVLVMQAEGTLMLRRRGEAAPLWARRVHAKAGMEAFYAGEAGGHALVSEGKGRISVLSLADGKLALTLCLLAGGEWASVLPEGFFTASRGVIRKLGLEYGGRRIPIDAAYELLDRPDLVALRASGGDEAMLAQATGDLPAEAVLAAATTPRILDLRLAEATPADSLLALAEVRVEGAAGQPLRIEWRLDGVRIPGEDIAGVEDIPALAATGSRRLLRFSVPVGWGEAELEARVFPQAGGAGSAPFLHRVRRGFAPRTAPPRLFVLALGVDRYPAPEISLAHAVADASAIARRLAHHARGVFGTVETTFLLDDQVSVGQVEAAFAQIARDIQPQDAFVLFMAGHGRTIEDSYFYVPGSIDPREDAAVVHAGMDQRQVQRWLARLPTARSLVIVDTCESGSLIDDATFHRRRMAQDKALGAFARATGRLTLTATTAYGQALDDVLGHGALTAAFLHALETADHNQNGLIEASELVRAVLEDAPATTERLSGWRQPVRAMQTGRDFALARSGTQGRP
jgi:Caspase domain